MSNTGCLLETPCWPVTLLLAFWELGPAPGGLTQHGGAAGADHDSVRVREDGGDPVAAGALGEDEWHDDDHDNNK